MKSIAKLTLFYSISFLIIFVSSILFHILASWVLAARTIPVEALSGRDPAEFAWLALPLTLYLSICLTLSYSARRSIAIPLSLICILILSWGFTWGLSLGITRTTILRPALNPVPPISAGPGLILSQRDNAMVLLRETAEVRGPRVIAIPGEDLIYQEIPLGPNNSILNTPAIPFEARVPWFIRSLDMDLGLSARELLSRHDADFYSFAAYAITLILLLASLRFLFELSNWPLVNFFIGALVFRGILSLEALANSREIQALIGTFVGDWLAPPLLSPLVFTALAVLVLFYTLLSRIVLHSSAGGEKRRARRSSPRRQRNG
ncbi:MAG: hypothetical protein FWH12_01235 [Treponema sp.]|nr:hypothetical protein [Treponema sp.]